MIEMVYNGKEPVEQGEVKLPKNIRQIGNNDSNKKNICRRLCFNTIKEKNSK